MSFSILNNVSALGAQNALNATQNSLSKTLQQLSTGSRINSGADDAAGLAIANGLQANITALNQSSANAQSGVGQLQVADGSLSQVTSLLNRAVTLATESANGGVSTSQRTALNAEFTSIKAEIDRIGSNTTFNGTSVFTSSTTSIFLSDAGSSSTIAVTTAALSSASITDGSGANAVNLSSDNLSTAAGASTSLTDLNSAIQNVASQRGTIGATINRLNAASTVIQTQVQNLTSAEDTITAANISQDVTQLSQLQVLSQTGISALSQANQSQQLVLKLLS